MIRRIYDALFAAYGPQHWWPGDTRDEIIIGAVLTQNTNWRNVERAIDNLRDAGLLRLDAIANAPRERLAELIRPSGYYNQKSGRLQLLARNLGDISSMSDLAARKHLLEQKGVGPETADSILLYAFDRPTFVIDAYTRRILSRIGVTPESDRYENWREMFMQALPPDAALYNEYHGLLVRHAKEHCRKTPLCEGCPLIFLCKHGGEI